MWNNLLDGALPGVATGMAATAASLGHVITARSTDRRWIQAHVKAPENEEPGSRVH